MGGGEVVCEAASGGQSPYYDCDQKRSKYLSVHTTKMWEVDNGIARRDVF